MGYNAYINGLADRTVTIKVNEYTNGQNIKSEVDVVIVDKIIKDSDTMYMVQYTDGRLLLIYPSAIIKILKMGFPEFKNTFVETSKAIILFSNK
jgi:hypothetical protein